MADASVRIHIGKRTLGTAPQLYYAPIVCNSIFLKSDKDWCWCSDKDGGVWEPVPAFQYEKVLDRADKLVTKDEPLIWIKAADSAGFLFDKCVRL